MSWEAFCKWWIDMFNSIGEFFIDRGPQGTGINNLERIVCAIIIIVAGIFINKLIMKGVKRLFKIKTKIEVDVSVKSFTLACIKVALYVILAIFVCAVLSIDLSSIAGILSAITVAIGLSLQDLISSFASGVILLKSKHFKTGDYIHLRHNDGECEGEVTSVNIISTTLFTVDNQKIMVPNSKLLNGVITNFSSNNVRRANIEFKVSYDTDPEMVKNLMMMLVNKESKILQDPKPVIFVSELGEYAMTFKLRFYTKTSDFWDIRNGFEEKIIKSLASKNIKIATKTVVVKTETPKEIGVSE